MGTEPKGDTSNVRRLGEEPVRTYSPRPQHQLCVKLRCCERNPNPGLLVVVSLL